MANAPEDRREMEAIGRELAALIKARRYSPDEAYAWVRVVCEMARPWREG